MEYNNFCSMESQSVARIESYDNEVVPVKFNKVKDFNYDFDNFNFTIENQQVESNYVFENQNHVIDISNIVGTNNILFNADLSTNQNSQTMNTIPNPINIPNNEYSQTTFSLPDPIDVSANEYSQMIDISSNVFFQQLQVNLNDLQNEFINTNQINFENVANINNILQNLTNINNISADNEIVADNNSEYINSIYSNFNINNNT